jgi:signal transduction histidine kinase
MPLDKTILIVCMAAGFCPLVLMLFMRSVARAYTLGICSVPLFIAIGGTHAVMCLVVLTNDWRLFIPTSHLRSLVLLSALLVRTLRQLGVWQMRYIAGVSSALSVLSPACLSISPDRLQSWLRCSLIALWLCFGAMTSSPAVTLLRADGVTQGLSLDDSVDVLRDTTMAVPASEVLSGSRDAEFESMGTTAIKCSIDTVCWMRVTLTRSADAPASWWLRARAVRPGSVQLFAGGRAMVDVAAVAPMTARQFPLSWRFVSSDLFFPISLQTSPTTFYMRFEKTQSADAILLLQDSGFERQQRRLDAYLNISAGATFALLILNLIFWYWLRDRLFLHFAFVMLTAVLLHAWQIVPSLSEPEHMGDLALRGAMQALFQAATVLFVARLFAFKQHFPFAGWIAVAFAALNILAGAVSLCGYPDAMKPMISWLELTVLAGTIGMAGWLVFVKRQWQYSWSAALMLLLALSSLIGNLRWMGLLDAGPDAGLGPTWIAARLTYMLLLAIVVADRMRRAEIQLQRSAEVSKVNALLAQEIVRRCNAEAGLKAALAAERKASQQQRQFVSQVSHEFRTPLAVIDAAAQSIVLPGVAIQPRIERIRRSVERLTTLVANCLAVDRLYAGSTILRPETINLGATVQKLSLPFAPADQARLHFEVACDAASVSADPALLDIALHNLVQNALKYSPATQEVLIRLTVHNHMAFIDVQDRGYGIPDNEKAKVFDRFFRGDETRYFSGSGLGLFLGKEIAQAHGGDISLVRSNSHGSVFRLSLPIDSDLSSKSVPSPFLVGTSPQSLS